MDSILKYISIITVAGAGISFIIGLFKYIDQRNREIESRKYEIYHDLMRRISARGEGDSTLPLTQQVAAIYELIHFKEYKHSSLPILKDSLSFYKQNNPEERLLTSAIESTIERLSE